MRISRQPPYVYYARLSTGNIKIGTSRMLAARMRAIQAVEVLAVESGSYTLERHRHQQFAEYALGSEVFRPSSELLDHIATLQTTPIPSLVRDEQPVVSCDESDHRKPTKSIVRDTMTKEDLYAELRWVMRAEHVANYNLGIALATVKEEAGASFTQLAERTGIPRSTVHRLISAAKKHSHTFCDHASETRQQ